MIISELIEVLQKFKEKEGDLPVYVPGHEWFEGMESETSQEGFNLMKEEHTNHDPINGELINPIRLTLT
jgi:hypothetical protein